MRKCPHRQLLEYISKSLDHRPRFRSLQKCQKRLGCLIIGSLLEKYRILKNRRMELVRYHPSCTPVDAVKLGQRDEAQLGVARIDELERLCDATALDKLRLKRVPNA